MSVDNPDYLTLHKKWKAACEEGQAVHDTNVDLRRALDVAMAENEQRMQVEQLLRADYAILRAVARRMFAQGVSEQSLLDLWVIADGVDHPGEPLAIRYNRAKAVVEAARLLDGNGTTDAAWDRLYAALAHFDVSLKEG